MENVKCESLGNPPLEKVSLVANTWVRMMSFEKAGDRNCGHAHRFDHQTLLASGRFRVYVEDKVAEFKAPTVLFVAAGKEHLVEALEDGSVAYCIHAVRSGDKVEDIMDPADIPADKWFGDETNPLVQGAPCETFYRTTPKEL